MKKIFFCFLILHSLLFYSQFNKCKEDLFPVRHSEKKMYGYVNIFGEWKVRPFYDLARPFKEGLAVVSRKKHYGLISCEGKVILPIDYEEIKDFVNGYSWVKKQGLWGLVDYNGATILECKYQEVVDVSRFDDYAWIKTNDLWGVFDKETVTFVHQPVYDKYQQLSHESSLVEKNGLKGMIQHSTSEVLLETVYESIDKFAPYLLSIKKEGKYGVVRDNGKKLLDTKYDAVQNMDLAKFSVKSGDKYAVYDVWGKQYIPFVLDSVGVFVNNAALVKMDGFYGYINHKGKRTLGKYEFATQFENRRALVKKKGLYKLIGRKGERISEDFEDMRLYPDYFAGYDGKVWRLFLYSSPTKISSQFLEEYGGLASRVKVKTSQGTQFYSVFTGTIVSNLLYDEINDWEGKYATIKLKDNVGLIDSSLKEVLAPKYESVEVLTYLRATYFKALNRDGKQLLFNVKGKQLLGRPYDQIIFAGRNKWIVSYQQNYGVVNHKNEVLLDIKYEKLICPDNTDDKYSWPLISTMKGKCGLINDDESYVVKPKSTSCEYMGAGYYKLTTKGEVNYVNRKGENTPIKTVERKIRSLVK